MTCMSSFFTSYSVYLDEDKVQIANDSLSSIAGQGDIPITFDLRLSSVCMFLSSALICYPLVILLKLLTVVFFFPLLIVCFRTW